VILNKEIKVLPLKRMALIIPIGLVVGSSVAWIGLKQDSNTSPQAIQENQNLSAEKLFSQSNRLIWKMVREGNVTEVPGFDQTTSALQKAMELYSLKGFEVKQLAKMIEIYQKDGLILSEACAPKAIQLNKYYQYERTYEDKFVLALEQIGLPELVNTYKELEKTRQEYIKKPSNKSLEEYSALSEELYKIITELYLDMQIEEPLFKYLKNHQNYVYSIASIYDEVGKDRILRLRDNTYAITTQLQLLPKL